MSQYTGAEIIIKLLERQGVDIVAGIPGGANLPIYDALFEAAGFVTSSPGTNRARASSPRAWPVFRGSPRCASPCPVPA